MLQAKSTLNILTNARVCRYNLTHSTRGGASIHAHGSSCPRTSKYRGVDVYALMHARTHAHIHAHTRARAQYKHALAINQIISLSLSLTHTHTHHTTTYVQYV